VDLIVWAALWNLINQVILPVINQPPVTPGGGHTFGLGDIQLQAYSYVEKPTGGPEWGMRFQVQFLLPK
jgi:hypothetical protein